MAIYLMHSRIRYLTHNQHPEYDPDVHDPQTPGTSYQNVLNITDLTKSKSAQPNEDLYNMIERR